MNENSGSTKVHGFDSVGIQGLFLIFKKCKVRNNSPTRLKISSLKNIGQKMWTQYLGMSLAFKIKEQNFAVLKKFLL